MNRKREFLQICSNLVDKFEGINLDGIVLSFCLPSLRCLPVLLWSIALSLSLSIRESPALRVGPAGLLLGPSWVSLAIWRAIHSEPIWIGVHLVAHSLERERERERESGPTDILEALPRAGRQRIIILLR